MKALCISGIIMLALCSMKAQVPDTIQTMNNIAASDILSACSSIALEGFPGEKLDLSYQNRILAQDEDLLVATFSNRTETSCWQSEFWGKWITSAILAYRYHPSVQLKEKLDNAVNGLIATQSADGYIGNYANDKRLEVWDIWGRKYCMLGLISYYDLFKEKKALIAAGKVADNLINELETKHLLIVKTGNHRGMAASSVLEPVCLLYARTGDKRYLSFAEEIVRQWEIPDGPQLVSKAGVDVSKRFPKPVTNWYGWEQGQKAYEMMSCYEGLLELYRLTGKNEYRQAVEKTWQNIRDTEINIAGSGASKECWFGGKALQALPIHHYQETCVTATWIKLSQQLLRLTGDAKYADAIEQALYNALLGSMVPDGSDWAKYSPLSGQRMMGTEQCGMGLNCCVASGPRGLFTLPLTMVMSRSDGIQVNFYAAGSGSLQTPGRQTARLVQTTDYPASGAISMVLEIPKAEEMTVRIRVPEWSISTTLTVNGETVEGAVAGQYTAIHRKWNNGDVINLILDMRGRVINQKGQPEYFAIVRGPVVLSRDARLPGLNVDAFVSPVADKDGYINLEPVAQKDPNIWMQYKALFIPESYAEAGSQPVVLTLCDYASAGNTYNENSRFRTWFPLLVDPSIQTE